MSLTMMAIRIAAIEAIKAGGTLVGSNVLDSQISAIDLTVDGKLTSDQQRPFIAVYTDAAKASDLSSSGLRTNGNIELIFNCGVSLTMATTNKETGESQIEEGFPATDAHFEAILDVLGCQIMRSLGDPDNPWAQVFGDLCQLVSKEQLRSSSAADKVRLAAGQIKLQVSALADPMLNHVLAGDGPWARLMALMAANETPQLSLFEQLLGVEVETTYPAFETLTGMSVKDAASLKLYGFGDAGPEVIMPELSTSTGPQ